MGYHRKRKIERGRKDAVFYEKGGYRPVRCRNVDRRKVLPSKLTNTIGMFNVYVNRNEAHFTYI